MKKRKLSLKKEYLQDLYETYPNAFDVKDITTHKKINNNFIKLMKKNIEAQKWIIENLGVTYIGYMQLLINTLNYENEVFFRELKLLGIKEGMINVVKKNLKETNLIAKKGSRFYLNPMIAIKGDSLDNDIVKLFE